MPSLFAVGELADAVFEESGGRRRCDMQGCVRTALTMLYGPSSMEYGGWTELEPGKC